MTWSLFLALVTFCHFFSDFFTESHLRLQKKQKYAKIKKLLKVEKRREKRIRNKVGIQNYIRKLVIKKTWSQQSPVSYTKLASPFQSTAALFAPENLLPLSDIVLSAGVQAQLNTMTQEDVINFKKLVQQHYTATCEHVFNKTPINKDLSGHILMNFRFLKLSELKSCSMKLMI